MNLDLEDLKRTLHGIHAVTNAGLTGGWYNTGPVVITWTKAALGDIARYEDDGEDLETGSIIGTFDKFGEMVRTGTYSDSFVESVTDLLRRIGLARNFIESLDAPRL